jgi:hypothetical protein
MRIFLKFLWNSNFIKVFANYYLFKLCYFQNICSLSLSIKLYLLNLNINLILLYFHDFLYSIFSSQKFIHNSFFFIKFTQNLCFIIIIITINGAIEYLFMIINDAHLGNYYSEKIIQTIIKELILSKFFFQIIYFQISTLNS